MAAEPQVRSTGTCAIEVPAVSVAVVDPFTDRRRRLVAALGGGGLRVLWEEEDAGTVAGTDHASVDAIVMAFDLLGTEELAAIGRVRGSLPDPGLVAVVSQLGRRSPRDAFDVGVDGVVLEETLDDCLPLAVRAACAGQLSLPRSWRAQVRRPVLSTRQKQILGMVVLGFTNIQIARKLYMAESTVKSHLSSAFTKLGVSSRNEATALILDPENGLGTGILSITDGGPEGDKTSAPARRWQRATAQRS
jgi:DNA-binding NarL/FixJ family response regulator